MGVKHAKVNNKKGIYFSMMGNNAQVAPPLPPRLYGKLSDLEMTLTDGTRCEVEFVARLWATYHLEEIEAVVAAKLKGQNLGYVPFPQPDKPEYSIYVYRFTRLTDGTTENFINPYLNL